jgi:hypothetical protein
MSWSGSLDDCVAKSLESFHMSTAEGHTGHLQADVGEDPRGGRSERRPSLDSAPAEKTMQRRRVI